MKISSPYLPRIYEVAAREGRLLVLEEYIQGDSLREVLTGGCLSVDEEHRGYVYRDFKIVVKAYNDLTGKEEHITARGYDAIVLQHEIDHLNGVLFYDHIDKLNPNKDIPNAVEI